jgi:hypothetical protein
MKNGRGQTFTEKYLSNRINTNIHGSHTRVTKVKETDYGYIVHKFNTYVTLWFIKLIVNNDGTAIARVRQEKNYEPTQRFTYYFDKQGREIISDSPRAERKIYDSIRAQK